MQPENQLELWKATLSGFVLKLRICRTDGHIFFGTEEHNINKIEGVAASSYPRQNNYHLNNSIYIMIGRWEKESSAHFRTSPEWQISKRVPFKFSRIPPGRPLRIREDGGIKYMNTIYPPGCLIKQQFSLSSVWMANNAICCFNVSNSLQFSAALCAKK